MKMFLSVLQAEIFGSFVKRFKSGAENRIHPIGVGVSGRKTGVRGFGEAEGEKKSAILKSEGDKESEINNAQAEKTAQILRAEGEAQAKVLQAQAEADAIRLVAEAVASAKTDPAAYMLAVKYIDTLKEMVSGKDNKTVYLPYEASNMLSSLGSIKDIFQK